MIRPAMTAEPAVEQMIHQVMTTDPVAVVPMTPPAMIVAEMAAMTAVMTMAMTMVVAMMMATTMMMKMTMMVVEAMMTATTINRC